MGDVSFSVQLLEPIDLASHFQLKDLKTDVYADHSIIVYQKCVFHQINVRLFARKTINPLLT